MISKFLLSSLKKQAKRLKTNKVSDVSLIVKIVNDRYKPEFVLVNKGQVVKYINSEDVESDYTPIVKLVGMIDFAKYETFNGGKTLAKNLKKLCEKDGIEDYKSVSILISYIEKKDIVTLNLFVDNKPIREIDTEELIN